MERGPVNAVAEQFERAVVAVRSLRPADSPRLSGEDEEHIQRLAEIDGPLPPITVHRPTMRVMDGMHRWRAAMLKGQERVEVQFFHGNENDAFLHSVRLNIVHGLPLTLADRKAAAVRIVSTHPSLSDRAIAQCSGLSARTVAAIRRSGADSTHSNTRRGLDGVFRPVDAKAGRYRAGEVIAARPHASLRDIAKAAGISVATAKDVRDRLRRGEGPVGPGRQQAGGRPRNARAPAGRTAQSDQKPAGRGGTYDPAASLERLRRDPALRMSASGRELLHRLHMQMTALERLVELVEAVPPHCTEVIAKLAEHYSKELHSFECDLRQRASFI